MNERPARPQPAPSTLSLPYWEGLARGELLLQACTRCGTLRHYPRLLCCACFHDGVRWQRASGAGRVHSWTVAHHAFSPAFADDVPYTLVTVDLDEGVRALGRWDGDALVIGRAVRARIDHRDGAQELVFEPA